MKKILKWFGWIVAVVTIAGVSAYLYLDSRYALPGKYTTGGPLSANQKLFDVTAYDIHLNIHSKDRSLSGYVVVTLKALSTLSEIELDFLNTFTVSNVDVDGAEAGFKHQNNKLWIIPDKALIADAKAAIKVNYSGKPLTALYPPWLGGFNWSKDANNDDWIGLSCQGEGAKIWLPCKDHPSDEPDSVTLHITVPDGYYCASNGLLRSVTAEQNGEKTFYWGTNYPINLYNIAINVAKYETVQRAYSTESGLTMPIYYYVLSQNRSRADSLIDMAVDMLYTYRKFFGEYPFVKEKFAVVETDYLGMEHQTINSYGNGYRYQVINGNTFDELMLHEMGHEWWGNKVTVSDWADFWIHEGFATYGEALYHLDKSGETGYHVYINKIMRQIKNNRPIVGGRDVNSFQSYHPDIYNKGAILLHSLRFLLGDSVCFKIIKEFATDSNYIYQRHVSTDDFIRLVELNAGTAYTPFITAFLYTTQIPEIVIVHMNERTYAIRMEGVDFELPMEVRTSAGTQKIMIGQNPVTVTSDTTPIADERNWFLKKTKLIDEISKQSQ
ncbi:M1 family metallopeptidase [bacterium]|nr:M1 family metallopeptidase [bacterium]